MEAILLSSHLHRNPVMATSNLLPHRDHTMMETGSLLLKAKVTGLLHLEARNTEDDQAS